MSPWLQTIFKVIVIGATMCSGIVVVKYDVPVGDQGHEGGQDMSRPDQHR
jgi:hypothetical protein